MTPLKNLWTRTAVGAFAIAGALMSSDVALAVSDKRAVAGAQNAVPAVPEPGAIVLFAAGAALVGWTIRRRRSED